MKSPKHKPDQNLLTTLLINREIDSKEKAEVYLNHAHNITEFDPKNIKDLEKSAKRIQEAIKNSERIHIFGDYDADGVCSTAIMIKGLKDLKCHNVTYRLPNRLTEGYSLSQDAVNEAIENKVDLLITVDCGTSNFQEIKQLSDAGIDVIVIDHHTIPEKLPEGIFALVNPHRDDCDYVFSHFCAAGVCYKLMQFMHPNPDKYLAIATIATVADCMPLVHENRYIVQKGLQQLRKDTNPGLQALLKLCDCPSKKADPSLIGFKIAPRINAAGRLGHADEALAILLSEDLGEAMIKGSKLETYNEMRRKMVFDAVEEATEQIKPLKNDHIIIISSKNWTSGIVGLVAGRICEKTGKPTIALEEGGDKLTASCRSIEGFNIVDALTYAKDHLDRFGGHAQAAGFSTDPKNLPGLKKSLQEYAQSIQGKTPPKQIIKIDAELKMKDITMNTHKTQEMLQPFGQANLKPLFLIKEVMVEESRPVGEGKKHLRLVVNKEGRTITCIAFNLGEFAQKTKPGTSVDIVFELDINEFRGVQSLQFLVKDLNICTINEAN